MHLEFAAVIPAEAEIVIQLLTREERDRTAVHVPAAEFSGAPNSLLLLHGERRLYVGLGGEATVSGQTVRTACGAASKFLQAKGRTNVAFDLAGWVLFMKEAVEGAILGTYRFTTFQPVRPGDPPRSSLERLTFVASATTSGLDAEDMRALGESGRHMAEATNYAREVANQPPNVFFPETLAEKARTLAAASGGRLEVEVLDEAALRAGGFGGLTAVGAGSIHPPRLVVLRYNGGAAGEAPVALVGKAITFDSGGLSIKPALGMEKWSGTSAAASPCWARCTGSRRCGPSATWWRSSPARKT